LYGIIEILNILSQPYALIILHLIHTKGNMTLSNLLMEMRALSKYKTIRKTVEKLIEAGLVKKEITKKGAIEKWQISLTEIGKKIAKEIHDTITNIIKS